MGTTESRSARRPDALSRERIIAAAIEILDSDGASALTFRALATRLSTGAGAIYWHVSGKDELLSGAARTVIARAIGAPESNSDPRRAVREIAVALFDAFDAHPWIGVQLSQESWRWGNALIFEAVGSKLQALGVPAASQFDAASALTNYISGAAGQNASHSRTVPRGVEREEFLAAVTEGWSQLDAAEFPFVHRVMGQLADHDDREQFLAGVDLILRGIAASEPSAT